MRTHILHNGLHRIGDQINHLIDPERFLGRSPFAESWLAPTRKPFTNIIKNSRYYDLRVALPGFNKQEVTLSVRGRKLTVKAEKQKEGDADHMLRSEFSTNALQRVFELPPTIDTETIQATLENGLLTIRLTYQNQELSRTIAIQ